MKLDISKVEFSKNDIKNNIKIPQYLTPELAYLVGIHIGDGCMNIYKRSDCNGLKYIIKYSGHEIDEFELHKKCITPLVKKLFNKKANIYLGYKTTITTEFISKAMLIFFNKSIGIPLSPKKDIDIPKIIKNSNSEIKKAFLKGLADTEFCITFKKRYRQKHYYPSITFGTQSKKLQKSVIKLLKEIGFNLCYISDYKTYRNNKELFINTINLNGLQNLNLWFKEIGFNSTKHLTKYEIWKKFGFCPPNTNIIERRKILKGEIDINSYYKGP